MHTCTHTHTHTHTHVFTQTLKEQKYGHEVRIISVDFSGGMEIYPDLAEQLQDLDIGILSKFFSDVVPSLVWLLLKVMTYCHSFMYIDSRNCKLSVLCLDNV